METLREDALQNAVKFLSHPSIKGSSMEECRTFLFQKGLSNKEVEEAFRRVKLSLQDNLASTMGEQKIVQKVPLSVLAVAQTYARPSLSQLAWAAGILVVAYMGTRILFKKVFLQRFKLWIRKIALEEDSENMFVKDAAIHTINAVKSASLAATEVIRVNKEMIKFHAEDKCHFHSTIQILETQTRELNTAMIAMRDVFKEKHRQNNSLTMKVQPYRNWYDSEVNVIKQPRSQKLFTDSSTASGYLPAVQSSEPDHAPHSKSYLEVLAILERGEKPPGIQEIDDKPPNPHQTPSESRLQPKRKPWEIVKVHKDDEIAGRRNFGSASDSNSPLTVASTQEANNVYELPVADSHDKGILTASPSWAHSTDIASPFDLDKPETGLGAGVNMSLEDAIAVVSTTPFLSVISDDESLNEHSISSSQYTAAVTSQVY